ncbi:MAG: hypothetical protein QNL33_12745 [Akkermansiaceae bacterium]|jgi:cytochrome c oxidase cbb3-type subunit 2
MTFKAFIFGMLASFGLPWLFAVVLPFSKMRSLEPVKFEEDAAVSGVYSIKRDGRITEGSKIYGQEGCYQCHTQLIRPTYAGWDVHRDEWAGLRVSADNAEDTRRETLPTDFEGEKVAHVGISRLGPDLSNFGRRIGFYLKQGEYTPEEWVLLHLYNPRGLPNYLDDQRVPEKSTCPSKGGMFDEVPSYQAGDDALPLATPDGLAVVPNDRARALASYLLSLKKDTLGQPLPKALNFNPEAPQAE